MSIRFVTSMRSNSLALAAIMAASSTSAAQLPDFPFVFVAGQATEDVAPEFAEVSLSIAAFSAQSDVSMRAVAGRTDEVLRLCEQHGIPTSDVVAYELDKRAVREMSDNYEALAILGYEVSRSLTITVRSLDTYPGFMAELVEMDNVTHIRTHFDVNARRAVEERLVGSACRDARVHAELMAHSAGVELGQVHALSVARFAEVEEVLSDHGGGFAIARQASRLPQNLFVPATIRIQKSVYALYRLEAD